MPTEALRIAEQLLTDGKLSDAHQICRQVLAGNPNSAIALQILGIVARKQERLEDALFYLEQSVARDPSVARSQQDLGDVHRATGNLDRAAACYQCAIALEPLRAAAYGALGNVLKDQGKLPQAIDAFTRAIQLDPGLAMAHLRLGDALRDSGQFEPAVAAFAKAIQLNPDFAEAYNSLGNLLWDQKQIEHALAAYGHAVRIRPAYLQANWSMGKVLAQQNRIDESVVCFQRAVQLNPQNPNAHLRYARILTRAGRNEEAIAEYRAAIAMKPDAADWRFELAARFGEGSATTVPAEYVKRLFDGYAPDYDKHLVDDLGFRVPQLIHDAVAAATPRSNLDILDLGCGTGLCGVQLRPRARRLVGVDLSAKMIQTARERKIYDRLINDDLMSALRAQFAGYDLIVAGDVLIYVGDLSELFPAVADALRAGGLFAFTIEHHEGDGFFLHSQERFAHAMSYIRHLAARAGLKEISAKQVILRKHAESGTKGWVVLLIKS